MRPIGCTYELHVPASWVLYVPEGSTVRTLYACQPRACRTYRVPSHHRSPQLLRCGRHPFLRRCTLADAAVRMQGPGCIRSMAKHMAVVQVMRQSNCTAKLNVNAAAEAIADREVARLRRACSRQKDALQCDATDANLTMF